MENVKKYEILNKFKPFLWSYDIEKIDLERDRDRIITNVLNLGTKEATDLLRQIYGEDEIRQVIQNPKPGEWSNKSLNYWSIIFDLKPTNAKSILRHIR